jgi:flagellar basal-body rod protein FlgG
MGVYAGLWVAASGMEAQARTLDVWAGDVANADTPGFLALVPTQGDAAPSPLWPAFGVPPASLPATTTLLGSAVATQGTAAEAASVDLAAGPLAPTGRPLDLALLGPGWFAVGLPGGSVAFTRAGRFGPDAAGTLVDPAGHPLLDLQGRPIRLPAGTARVQATPEGEVLAWVGGRPVPVAQIGVALIEAPAAMAPLPGGLWQATPAAGAVRTVAPGTAGAGRLASGVLEGSNVDLVATLTGVLEAERAYQANARAFSTALAMWDQANGILA